MVKINVVGQNFNQQLLLYWICEFVSYFIFPPAAQSLDAQNWKADADTELQDRHDNHGNVHPSQQSLKQ